MTVLAVPGRLRRGAGYWLGGYRAMVRWHLVALRMWLPLLMVVQVLFGAGFVLGLGLFFEQMPPSAALYIATGVPVVNLVMVGLILGPQLVAQQKTAGTYEFLQSLPVRRTATALAWYTVTLAGGLPGMLVALLLARARYDLDLTVSAAVAPAVLLTTFTGTMIGYALAHAIANPMATQLIVQVLVFAIFGYCPIMFPAEQMPGWLAAVNEWLPFGHMAVIVRDGLTTGVVGGVAHAYAIVAAWAVGGAALAALALGRRR